MHTIHPLTRASRLTSALLAFVIAIGLSIGSAAPARADGHLGLLFDGTPDFTLPNTAITRQITDASVNEGYVQIPFSAAALNTLLAGPTFNGPANLPDGRSVEVRTAFTVERFFGNRVMYDQLLFGLSPDGQRASCDFSALTREVTRQSLDGPVNATPSSDRSVSVTYVVGDELNVGAKIGFIRITPTPENAGKWVCMYRETLIREVNNPTPTTYDVQRSQVVMTAEWINIGFPGALSDPGSVEEEPAEEEGQEEAAEVAAPEPEAQDVEDRDEAAATEPEPEAPADADAAPADAERAEANAEPDESEVADNAGPVQAAPDTAASTVDPAEEQAPDATTVDASAAGAEDEGGPGLLIPVLIGLVAMLLGGIVIVLARRPTKEQPPAAGAEPGSDGPQG